MIKPFLYYIIYCNLSQSEFNSFNFSYLKNTYHFTVEYKSRDEMQELLSFVNQDPLASVLYENAPQLVDKTRDAKSAMIISGEYNYKEINEVQDIHQEIAALTMQINVISCLDLLTFNIYSPEEFYKLQEEISASQNFSLHTMIFVSSDDVNDPDSFWLHTRGMAKFGLPDLSINHVPQVHVENIFQVFTFLINDLVLGIQKINKQPDSQSTLNFTLAEGNTLAFSALFTGSLDDPEFNNYHLQLKVMHN